MEMGKLTAKLRDAVPVCLIVDDKEIKRYKNIEIPDELKKLEYQDFKFDVPLNGAITFKIIFEPGVLPEEFPQDRERRTRIPKNISISDESKMPTAKLGAEGYNEATRSPATAIHTDADKNMIENVAEEEVNGLGSLVEAHANEETTPKAKAELEDVAAVPAKKEAAKPKKAPMDKMISMK